LSLTILAGCSDPIPEGQVAAIANGEDVTDRDIEVERASGDAPDSALARQIIDRRLLAEVALERGIATTPEYLAGLRRTREQLLVQGLSRQIEASLPVPTAGERAAYIAGHPHAFARRTIVELQATADAPPMVVDSARISREVAAPLLDARPGATVEIGGARYAVVSRRDAPLAGKQADSFADQSLRTERLTDAIRQVLAEQQASASVSYRKGL
jgi:hypothetical protein